MPTKKTRTLRGPPAPSTPHRNRVNRCFGCGSGNQQGLRLKFRARPEGPRGSVQARARIPRRFAGAPDFLHGGIVATLLDEAMSKVNAFLGVTAVTHHLEVDFRRPVPPSTPLLIEGQHRMRRGSRLYNEARISTQDGRLLATARARFVVLSPDAVSRLTKRR